MKGIDTNVLVRYLVQDDAKQSLVATRFIETACDKDSAIFINHIVLCELVWVLESAYDYPKQMIITVLDKILSTRQFYIHQSDILWKALHDYQHHTVDFADCCIAHLNDHAECEYTATFDKGASRLTHFKKL